jgi:hypothetical protein
MLVSEHQAGDTRDTPANSFTSVSIFGHGGKATKGRIVQNRFVHVAKAVFDASHDITLQLTLSFISKKYSGETHLTRVTTL